MSENKLRKRLEELGFIPNAFDLTDNSADSYHLELIAPKSKSRYMFSIFDTLYKKYGNAPRELEFSFETLDDDGDHNEVVNGIVETEALLEDLK